VFDLEQPGASSKLKDGKEKASWCGIYKGAERGVRKGEYFLLALYTGRTEGEKIKC